MPIVKAKLRFLWRKCYQECNHVVESSKPPPAAVSTSTLAKSSPKELPSGYWQQQVAKFEAVKIGSEARKFPQEKLIGAEAVIARVVHEMRTESHTAIGLHEVVQSRYFDASGNPNPLSAAKKKNKSQAAVLTINADYQIETEADIPWQPKSVLAFVDCLESIRLLLILVEMGSEASVERYFNWFEKQVRSRPHKLEQLRVYWESTSWRIALALRAKQSFKAIVEEIIHDNQSLQDALSKEFVLQPRYDRYDTARQSPYGWTSNSWSSPSWQGSSWSSWQQKQSQFAQDDRNVQKEHPDHREPLQRKVHRRESGNSVPVDAILLSFFDGVGSAGLVFQQICQEKSWTGRMLLWETDRDLVKLTAERFPEAEHRGDVDADKACKIIERLEAIDPEHQATIIIAGGPPCHDYSRIRSAPPGTKGEEGSKFLRFAQLVKELECNWAWPQAVVVVENVVPQNKADIRAVEQALACQAGKVDSQTQARWLADNRSYAPWHYQEKNMFTDKRGAFRLATAEVKEQLHHLPCGWTDKLHDKARHRALANGWHLRAAKYFFLFGLLSTTSDALRQQPNPLGADAIQCMVSIWESAPLLNGPGVPMLAEAVDISLIDDPYEHWAASRGCLHPAQQPPHLEPGLQQWLPIWLHYRKVIPEMRKAVTLAIEDLVAERGDETAEWMRQRPPHVQKAYSFENGKATVQVPIIKELAMRLGWKDPDIFDELENGFPLLGPIRAGLGWRLRHDGRYDNPAADWQVMADEIAADVKRGRMEGPFEMPECWGIGADGQPKVRRAEDWRRSGANATVGVPDSPAYHDITAFVTLAKAIRAEVSSGDALELWGLDHEAAYRQFPVEEPSDTWVILSTPAGPTLWRHNVLMFGSTASVWSYCRVADLMAWLCRALLLVPLLHFVDDFGSNETKATAPSAFSETQSTCKVLGLKFKDVKAQPPAKTQKLFGVSLTLEHDKAVVECTDERRQRLDSMLLQILLDNELKPRQASALAGKLQFIAQSMFGKASIAAVRPFHQRAQAAAFRPQQQGWQLSLGLRSAIAYLRYRLAFAKPRILHFHVDYRTVIYADAFFNLGSLTYKLSEAESAPDWGKASPASFVNGLGFVVTVGDTTFFANGSVPYWFVRHFSSRRSFIFLLEILAQVVPLMALEPRLHRHCLLFVDNEPAKHALVKGYGKDESINRLLQAAWIFIENAQMHPEWQRVSSSANVSDSVSRGDFTLAARM
ncbi:unnamed protein product, partial [Symbiodinium sp. KB8]